MNQPIEQISNFKSVFNHFVGFKDKPHTPKSLSLITGIGHTTIHSHMREVGGSMPSLPMLMLYMKVLDSAFADAIFSPAGLTVSRADEHEAPTTHQAMSRLAKTMHAVAVAIEDLDVDNNEKRELSPTLRATGQDLIALANTYDDDLNQ